MILNAYLECAHVYKLRMHSFSSGCQLSSGTSRPSTGAFDLGCEFSGSSWKSRTRIWAIAGRPTGHSWTSSTSWKSMGFLHQNLRRSHQILRISQISARCQATNVLDRPGRWTPVVVHFFYLISYHSEWSCCLVKSMQCQSDFVVRNRTRTNLCIHSSIQPS